MKLRTVRIARNARHALFFLGLFFCLCLCLFLLAAGPARSDDRGGGACVIPPTAPKKPKEFHEFGHTRVDDYYWMRERDSAAVLDYLRAENDYAERYMSRYGDLVDRLFEELKGRETPRDDTVPFLQDGYYYYDRFEEGKEFAVHCRRKGSLDSPEEVFLDENELAEGHDFFHMNGWAVTPDGKRVAYAVDTMGRRKYTIVVRSIESGELLGGSIRDVTSAFAWANDNRTLFYAKQHPETLRWYRIYRHDAAGDPAEDFLLYEEEDETFDVSVSRSMSGRYILIRSEQTLSDEYRYVDADEPLGEPVLFAPRQRDMEYRVDHAAGRFFIRTNRDAVNFRVMTATPGATGRDEWKEIVPHREERLIESVLPFDRFLVVSGREGGLTRLEIVPLDGGDRYDIEFDEPAYYIETGDNREPETKVLRFVYSSMTTPETVFDYDVENRERTLLKRKPVGGDFDPGDYVTERVAVPARDGARVPMTLLYRKGIEKDGANPVHLYGYGSYGWTTDPRFHAHRFTLVDRGFIYALAHVRGGDILGRQWYEDGKLLKKKNTFYDFIDCAEYLIDQGYTSKELLTAQGGSAGGLLIGAVVNMRPDLFRAAVADVPFVDVITTMLDDSIPLTTAEYDEWGNPNEKEAYEYMLTYSPYDNVAAKDYPALLITAGYHDSQVQYWEPAKWAAKLRGYDTGTEPILLKTNMSAGHGGAYGRFESYREYAFMYAFLIGVLGVDG